MKLIVVGTGSSGNSYILEEDGHKLILDAGMSMKEIIKASGGLDGVEGCLITHEHYDHTKDVCAMMQYGIVTYGTIGTLESLCVARDGIVFVPFWRAVEFYTPVETEHYMIMAFPTEHDARMPCGFLIKHKMSGMQVLYATDTYYLRNTFPNINVWIVECNYIDEMLKIQDEQGLIEKQLVNRLRKSHMSLARLKQTLKANDLSKTCKIVLVHLSDARSDEVQMVTEISEMTGIETIAADAGMVIDLNLIPF